MGASLEWFNERTEAGAVADLRVRGGALKGVNIGAISWRGR